LAVFPAVRGAITVDLGSSHASALFLDFDGTLVEIADTPDAVVVLPALVASLMTLRTRLRGALAVISGRQIAAIDSFLGPETFDVAGLHGAEYRLAGDISQNRDPPDPAFRAAVRRLAEALAGEPLILVEDKGISVAIHWRLAPHAAGQARNAVADAVVSLGPGYRLQQGKAVAEILPVTADKGRVLETFMASPPYRGRRPIFVGDDLTDEHGFAVVNACGGLSIKIGSGPTQAQAFLDTPADLRQCLDRWAAAEAVTIYQAGEK
jgi:trehalose 6-phosphate phosphatase